MLSKNYRKILRIILWLAIVVVLSWMAHPSRGTELCPPGVVCDGQTCRLLPQRPTVPIRREAATRAAVVRITNSMSGGKNIGSGTLIEGGLVLTCGHLFDEGAGTVVVSFADGTHYEAKLLKRDAAWDLAALRIAPTKQQAVRLANEAPKVGEWLRSCGYGRDGRYRCNRGQVRGYVRPQGTSSFETLELSGMARQGDSGGPIFNAAGELVAVLWGTNGRIVGGTYCGRIRKFLGGLLGGPRQIPLQTPQTPSPDIMAPPQTTPQERPWDPPGLKLQPPAIEQPKQPDPSTPSALNAVIAELRSRIAGLEVEVALLKRLEPFEPSPAGNDGERGPQGKRGPRGAEGKFDETQPLFTVQTVKDGKVIESTQVYLGGVLSLRLVPVKPSGGSQ